jgi:uncharacterized protein (DUF2132 family)
MTDPDPLVTPQIAQPRNPLHGIKLEGMITALVDCYGCEAMRIRTNQTRHFA